MVAIELKQRLLERLRKAPTRLGLLLVLVIGSALIGGYKAHHYITRESAFCVSCHSDTSKAVSQQVHKNLTCQGCHNSKFLTG